MSEIHATINVINRAGNLNKKFTKHENSHSTPQHLKINALLYLGFLRALYSWGAAK